MTCQTKTGYIYVRRHSAYDGYDACKLGITTDLVGRDFSYATSEIERGIFCVVYKILNCRKEKLKTLERLLHDELKFYHGLGQKNAKSKNKVGKY